MACMEERYITAVEEILGHKFQKRALLQEAMTHPSLAEKKSYERLEFLGDAVIKCGVAVYLYRKYPHLPAGQLRLLCSANVDKEKLARIAVTHGLHRYLRHNSLNLESQIHDFVEDLKNYPIHSNGSIATPNVLFGIVKSLSGSVYADTKTNHETAQKVFERLSDSFVTIETLQTHPVT